LIGLSWIGLAYQVLGGKALFFIDEHGFYLTTFAKAIEVTIRPAGVYDEPGSFSFFICLLVVLREALGMRRSTSTLMIVGGLVTQSAAHMVFSAIWLLGAYLDKSSAETQHVISKVLSFIGAAFLCVVYLSGYLDWAIDRMLLFVKHPESWPRYISLITLLRDIEIRDWGWILGPTRECAARIDCLSYGENMLSPLAYGGLLSSWPYYVALWLGAYAVFKLKIKGLQYFALCLLLLQRPYVTEFPYSFALGLLLILYVRNDELTRASKSPRLNMEFQSDLKRNL
jgi:hypothetical protein